MRWFIAVVALAGCKYPDPGFQLSDDQPPDDADTGDGDATPDGDAAVPVCPEFTTIDNQIVLPGKMVAGFSPTEDESFAISWLPGDALGVTEQPFGQFYSPTDIPNQIVRAHVTLDGSAVYFFDLNGTAGMRMRRATNAGTPTSWNANTWAGIPDGYPGRITRDGLQMVFNNDTVTQEVAFDGAVWEVGRTYTAEDFGNEATAIIGSANLSPDGAILVYTLEGKTTEAGIHMRVRVNGSFDLDDGSYGRALQSGPYVEPVLTQNCSHLFVFNTTTRLVERFDTHP